MSELQNWEDLDLLVLTYDIHKPHGSAYDNGQSSDIFRPIKAFDRSNQIWSVKYSIHYQWESHQVSNEATKSKGTRNKILG